MWFVWRVVGCTGASSLLHRLVRPVFSAKRPFRSLSFLYTGTGNGLPRTIVPCPRLAALYAGAGDRMTYRWPLLTVLDTVPPGRRARRGTYWRCYGSGSGPSTFRSRYIKYRGQSPSLDTIGQVHLLAAAFTIAERARPHRFPHLLHKSCGAQTSKNSIARSRSSMGISRKPRRSCAELAIFPSIILLALNVPLGAVKLPTRQLGAATSQDRPG